MPGEDIRLFEGAFMDPDNRRVAEGILGCADPPVIRAELATFLRVHLNTGLDRVAFCAFSVGVGLGLVLEDGTRVFLKAWPPATDVATLRAVGTVQDALARRGFPAPRILVPPTPFMAGNAVVMEWIDRGAQEDAARPGLRRTMAAALARLVDLAQPFVDLPGLPRHEYPAGGVWGAPHNALYDFGATAAGAEWIDELGAAAAELARRAEGRLVLGHRDWRVENMRFTDGAVSVVYDWDALAVAREPALVGMAAATFPVAYDQEVPARFPAPPLMAAFIADYQAATGRAFTPGERRTAWAAATYLLAYVARCEHCLDARVDRDSARDVLRRHGAELLEACR